MSGKAKERILPFFLPMYGCPHRCIFCDQNAISGESAAPSYAQVAADISAYAGGGEVAFYGGSFTCLPREMQEAYLREGEKGIAAGKFEGIRISTRPDAVDEETCAFLKAHHVTTVELGIQSLDDAVLQKAGRGYDAAAAKQGMENVRAQGFRLGVQLMTGLPGDTGEKDIRTLKACLPYEPELLRIYPTLVLEGTPLAALWRAGDYQPETLEEAVTVCRDLLAIAMAAGITVQRMGINPSEEVERSLLAGPYHPAFGGMVKEALKREQIFSLLTQVTPEEGAMLMFPKNELPLIFGQNRSTMLELGRRFPSLALVPDGGMEAGMLILKTADGEYTSRAVDFCKQIMK